MSDFRIYETAEQVAQAAAGYLFEQIKACVESKGVCHIVLPGGSTPARCLELLADEPLPWQSIHWYPGDERCYPVGHAERNDSMILKKLFATNIDAAKTFHPVPAEKGPAQGAEEYTMLLADYLCESDSVMDIVVLGMGEDGHTASLFPGNAALKDVRQVVPVYDAPKAPLERVSLGMSFLKNADKRLVITTGDSKREILSRIQRGEVFPVSQIEPDIWFVDQAAGNMCTSSLPDS